MADRGGGHSQLPALLPALLPAPRPPNGTKLPSRSRPEKRRGTSACDACHSRKIKCDAARPQCSSCVGRSTAPCRYATTTSNETHSEARRRKRGALESQNSLLQNLFHLLQTRPEHEAHELLGRIRVREDVESIVNHVRDGDLLLQMALVPESRTVYEFPLVPDMPLSLQVHDNPYLKSVMFQYSMSTSEQTGFSAAPSQYGKPFHAATVVDPILASVKPSKWTNVSANDELMRELLQAYFAQEYMWFTFLHKDLFLEDMLSGANNFCSPMLVNAVLAYGCHCHRTLPRRANYWDPSNIAYRFLAEAKRQWDLEQRRSGLTTVQTALFLNAISNIDGADVVGRQYTIRAIDMASDMKLFSAREPSTTVNVKMQICREYTAWALFCWQAMVCYVMFLPPLIRPPPECPLPDPHTFPQWYGETWIKYPLDTVPISTHHGNDFRSRAHLCCIMSEICVRYFSTPAPQGMTLIQSTLYFYSLLRSWFDNLPGPLTVARLVFPSHLKLHMQYNLLLVNLFKPWVETQVTAPEYTAFVNQVQQTPTEAMNSAMIRMETVFRMYYVRHGFDAMDGYMVHFFNALGFMSLEQLKTTRDPVEANNRRCVLLMCALGLREQGQYYHLVRTIFHLFRGSMAPEDIRLLNRYVRDQPDPDKDELHRPQDIDSEYPLNIIDISDNPQRRTVTYLVREGNENGVDPEH